jgi:hypothetical protein
VTLTAQILAKVRTFTSRKSSTSPTNVAINLEDGPSEIIGKTIIDGGVFGLNRLFSAPLENDFCMHESLCCTRPAVIVFLFKPDRAIKDLNLSILVVHLITASPLLRLSYFTDYHRSGVPRTHISDWHNGTHSSHSLVSGQ